MPAVEAGHPANAAAGAGERPLREVLVLVVGQTMAAVGEAHPLEAVDPIVPLADARAHVEVEAWLAPALGVVDGPVHGGPLVEVLGGPPPIRVVALGHPRGGAETARADEVASAVGAAPLVPEAGAAATPLLVAPLLVATVVLHRRPASDAPDQE